MTEAVKSILLRELSAVCVAALVTTRRLCRVCLYRTCVYTVHGSPCAGSQQFCRTFKAEGESERAYSAARHRSSYGATSVDHLSKRGPLTGGQRISFRAASRDDFPNFSRFVAGLDFPFPFLSRSGPSPDEPKFITPLSSQFQVWSVKPGAFFYQIKHCLYRPAVP